LDFIRSENPIDALTMYNQFDFSNFTTKTTNKRTGTGITAASAPAAAAVKSEDAGKDQEHLKKLLANEATTAEIVKCCEDLRLLGKGDFKSLLRWRLSIREAFPQIYKTSTDGEQDDLKQEQSKPTKEEKDPEAKAEEEAEEEEEEEEEESESESESGSEGLSAKELKAKEKKRKDKKKRESCRKKE